MKKPFLALVLLICSMTAFAQTHSIALKSLSLTDTDPFPSHHERFGVVYEPPPIIKIERITTADGDLTIITLGKVFSYSKAPSQRVEMETHTVNNHPVFNDLSLDVDSLKKTYPDYVEWVGFNEKQKDKKKEFILPFGMNVPRFMLLLLFISGLFYLKRTSQQKEINLAI